MWTEKNVVNSDAFLFKLALHPIAKGIEILFAVITSTDTTLIGGNNQQKARRLQFSAGFENAVYKREFFWGVYIGVINIDHAVTIQKSSLF